MPTAYCHDNQKDFINTSASKHYLKNWLPCKNECYLHCLGLKLSGSNSFNINFSSLADPLDGLRTKDLPKKVHGSFPTTELPRHHPPGVKWSDARPSSLASIVSRTELSLAKECANGAPLFAIASKCSVVRLTGCVPGGLSHAMKRKSLLMVVFW